MTQTATPERVKLAHIVASGLHQLAAAAAQQLIEDRIERGRADANIWNDFDQVAINLKAPYMAALAALAGDELIMNKTCNESCIASEQASKVSNDEQIRRNPGISGTDAMHGRPARRGRKTESTRQKRGGNSR